MTFDHYRDARTPPYCQSLVVIKNGSQFGDPTLVPSSPTQFRHPFTALSSFSCLRYVEDHHYAVSLNDEFTRCDPRGARFVAEACHSSRGARSVELLGSVRETVLDTVPGTLSR